MEIRQMTLNDFDSISPILTTEFDDFWNPTILKNELSNPNSIYFIYEDNGEIIGFGGITIILDTAELNNIVIRKSYRGNGFSSIILEKLVQTATQKKCIKINLEVSKLNNVALNLYKKFGFKQVGLREKYYNGIDAILLTKELR